MKLVKRYFVTGLLVVIPTWATWFILKALYTSLENVLRPLLAENMQGRYIPGLGLVTLVAILVFVGMLAHYAIGRKMIGIWEYLMTHVPVVRNVYLALKGVVDALAMQQRENLQRVVMIEYPRRGIYALGFVTGSAHGQVGDALNEHALTVFLPTTPNPTSGFLLLVPEREVIPLPMSIEEGMKMIISGGMYMPPPPGESSPGPAPQPA